MQESQTEVVRVDPIHPDLSVIERASSFIRAGEVVAFPTETVYGLGADAFQTSALERIFTAKGRPLNDPLIVHIADEEIVSYLVSAIPEHVKRLAQAFWPGPLTMVLPRSSHVPDLITAGLPSVAIRMPRHPVALALIQASGSPIAAPSANRFMHVSPTTAQHVVADLGGRIPFILDGGSCEIGVESTVVNLCTDVPVILRPGGISLEALRTILPDIQPPAKRLATYSIEDTEEQPHHSPGQMLVHYAPAVPLLLFDGTVEAMRSAMLQEVQQRRLQGERVGVLVAAEDMHYFQECGALLYQLGVAADHGQVAAALFAGLRVLEEANVHVILCRNFDEQGLGLAIRDRLLKAAGGKLIHV